MNEIDDLRQRLSRALLGRAPGPALSTPDPAGLQQLAQARQRLVPPRGRHALPRIAQGVLAFRLRGSHTPYPDLKYACLGIARPTDWEGRLMLDDDPLCEALLAALSRLQQRRPWAFAQCCRSLGAAWANDIAPHAENLSATARQNAGRLAEFLHRSAAYLT